MNNKHNLRLFAAAVMAGCFLICASCSSKQDKAENNEAERLLEESQEAGDFEACILLIDSLEQTGDITPLRANRARGTCYHYLDNPQKAEYYYRKAYKCKLQTKDDQYQYIKTCCLLSDVLKVKGEYEEALRVMLPAIKQIEEGKTNAEEEYFNMLFTLGECQYRTGNTTEAQQNFEKATELLKQMIPSDSTGMMALNMMENCFNVSSIYEEDADTAMVWLKRSEEALNYYAKLPAANPAQTDYCKAFILQSKAKLLRKLGKTDEAEKAFEAYLANDVYQTETGKIGAAEYYYQKGDWSKAADCYEYVDTFFTHRNMQPTLMNIKEWMLPRYQANADAGRTAKTIAIGRELCQMLDSAIVNATKDKAAELATIYETQQKESQIAQQQAEISHQRIIGLVVAIIALTIFFIIYTLVRRRAAARLTEMKAAQERIESELRIAREIQMSMVPSEFPKYEGLDMFASMAPAKEVGGDMYGYVVRENMLYFAVGDVSGKGIPASLFMAQATRLFRTLAHQDMLPAEICTRMNRELSGADNSEGMFITMFIGMLDMQTGLLNFCNAGHNPPIIGGGKNHGDFLEMKPNAPIGLFQGLEYDGEKIETIKDRPIFIYTDGLNEAENAAKEQFGEKRLLDIMRSTNFSSVRQVIDYLNAEVEKHRNGAEPNDDLTMMCLCIKN